MEMYPFRQKMDHKERGTLFSIRVDGLYSEPFRIKKDKLLIGRGDSCEIIVNIDDVSPEHCVISFNDEGRGFVEPITKSCLTLLNGELIKRQVSLEHSDVITIVKQSFSFFYPSSSKFYKATQQLIVSCKEKPKNGAISAWSKAANPFMPNHVKEEKKVMSCATQTDVPDCLIDTENPEDEDLSSLDAKDVTLLTERMKELLIKGSDHDVKIVVKDKEFRAHRIILRTRSPVLAMMLTHDSKESSTGTINIEDCDPDSFDEFLLYVYSGRTENLTPSKALQLYYTADKYNLPALKKRCAIVLKTSLSVASICDVILLAAKHGEKELLEAATEFFAQNLREILETVRWQEFLSENPVEGNELYIKSMDILLPRK